MKTTSIVFSLVTAAILLSGCNTIEGIGEDLEAGGEKIQETANDTES